MVKESKFLSIRLNHRVVLMSVSLVLITSGRNISKALDAWLMHRRASLFTLPSKTGFYFIDADQTIVTIINKQMSNRIVVKTNCAGGSFSDEWIPKSNRSILTSSNDRTMTLK